MKFTEKREITIKCGHPSFTTDVPIMAWVHKDGNFAIHKRVNNSGWALTVIPQGLQVFSATSRKKIEEATERWLSFGRKLRKQYKPKDA